MASMDRQQEFVLRTLEERDIRFVRLWFTDVSGYLKAVAVAPAEIEAAFAEGIGFDGSAIEGFARVYESDMLAKPDPGTFQVMPAREGRPSEDAILTCRLIDRPLRPSFVKGLRNEVQIIVTVLALHPDAIYDVLQGVLSEAARRL